MSRKIITAVIGVIQKDNKYLLTHRHEPNHPDVHARWQLPGGGVEYGESLLTALRRELMEEVGIEIINPVYIPVPFQKITPRFHAIFNCFICNMKDEKAEIKLNEEADTYGWFTQDKIKELNYLPLLPEIIQEAEKVIKKCVVMKYKDIIIK